jgi:hypothetical protein
MKYTIGYIKHNNSVNELHIGPSIENLKGEFEVITTEDTLFPAENYNHLLSECKTDYLILSHEDVTFPSNLLEKIEMTITYVPDFGCLGMVGVDENRNYHWSSLDKIVELDTLDCCFLVINMKNRKGIKFDTETFGEYHLYVEDFCAQMKRVNKKKIYTIGGISAYEKPILKEQTESDSMGHHSATVNQRGYCWGRYTEFRRILESKWPNIKTT